MAMLDRVDDSVDDRDVAGVGERRAALASRIKEHITSADQTATI